MPTPTKGPRLGSGPAHERLLLAGLATQLFEHGSITTTEAKAKRLRPLAERLVTFAKRGDLAARRRVLSTVKDKGVVHALFADIGPAMAGRPGGYTRITKIGPRKGDNAPMAVIELVTEPLTARAATVREAEAATARSVRGAAPAAEAATNPQAQATSEAAAGPEAPSGAATDEGVVDGSTEAAESTAEAAPVAPVGETAAVTEAQADVDEAAGSAPAGGAHEAPRA